MLRSARALLLRFRKDLRRSPLKESTQPDTIRITSERSKSAPLIFVGVYLLVQLLLPLRHWLYSSDVNWSEEGHRFSWRMKLRDKSGMMRIFITDRAGGLTWEITPAVDLSARQIHEMSTRPDMVLQYVHFLAERYGAGGRLRPMIRVEQQVSLNGRPYQHLIDPTLDLAAVEPSFAPADWILPLNAPFMTTATQ
jgi:hypothetical protein